MAVFSIQRPSMIGSVIVLMYLSYLFEPSAIVLSSVVIHALCYSPITFVRM
jgi:hypothetical protein